MTIEQWNLQIKDIQNTKIIANAEQLLVDYMEVKSLHGNEKCIFPDNVVTFVKILKRCMEEIAKKDKNGGIEEIDLSYEDFSKQDFSFPGIKDSTGGEEIEVFISYACPNEKDLACQIYEQIREAGKSVWMDIMLEKEKKLNEQLEYVLRSCKDAIILLSETYKEKAWTRYEIIRLCEESKKRNLNITIYNFLDEKVDLCNVLNDKKHITSFTNAKVINMFER